VVRTGHVADAAPRSAVVDGVDDSEVAERSEVTTADRVREGTWLPPGESGRAVVA
jgi:hypothetical protein